MHRFLACVLLVLGATPTTWACSTPVFRYALERWHTEPHLVVVPPADLPGQGTAVDAWPGRHVVLDSDEALAPGSARIDFPDDNGTWWQGALPPGGLAILANSPAGDQAARLLAAGSTIVFLLVPGGDPATDAAFAAALRTRLDLLAETVELPTPDEPPEDAEEEGLDPRDQPLLPHIPLRIHFPILTVAVDNPAEAGLLAQIRAITPAETAPQAPRAVPVFGHLRALPPLVGPLSDPSAVDEVAYYLTGACSCEIKDLNPGVDLLQAVDWDALLWPSEDAPATMPATAAAPADAPIAAAHPRPAPEVVVIGGTAAALPASPAPRSTGVLLLAALAAIAAAMAMIAALFRGLARP
jgi:hypothetical protein